MRTATISVAIVIGILALADGSFWGLIAAFAMVFAAYAAPNFWDDRELRRRQRDMAAVCTERGLCPHGYRLDYDPDDIKSRCKDACYDKCYDCILVYISGQSEGYRERVQRMNEMGLEFPPNRPDYEGRCDVQSFPCGNNE